MPSFPAAMHFRDPSDASRDAVQRLFAEVHGQVQGVGFRHFTKVAGRRLGLTGFVRNEPDGSVTVVAEGPRERLDELVTLLRDGPRNAAVGEVDVRWESARGTFDAFTVER